MGQGIFWSKFKVSESRKLFGTGYLEAKDTGTASLGLGGGGGGLQIQFFRDKKFLTVFLIIFGNRV